MVVKLKKPFTVDLGNGKQRATLVFPADETFLAETKGGDTTIAVDIPCGSRRVELSVVVTKDAVEIVVP